MEEFDNNTKEPSKADQGDYSNHSPLNPTATFSSSGNENLIKPANAETLGESYETTVDVPATSKNTTTVTFNDIPVREGLPFTSMTTSNKDCAQVPKTQIGVDQGSSPSGSIARRTMSVLRQSFSAPVRNLITRISISLGGGASGKHTIGDINPEMNDSLKDLISSHAALSSDSPDPSRKYGNTPLFGNSPSKSQNSTSENAQGKIINSTVTTTSTEETIGMSVEKSPKSGASAGATVKIGNGKNKHHFIPKTHQNNATTPRSVSPFGAALAAAPTPSADPSTIFYQQETNNDPAPTLSNMKHASWIGQPNANLGGSKSPIISPRDKLLHTETSHHHSGDKPLHIGTSHHHSGDKPLHTGTSHHHSGHKHKKLEEIHHKPTTSSSTDGIMHRIWCSIFGSANQKKIVPSQ